MVVGLAAVAPTAAIADEPDPPASCVYTYPPLKAYGSDLIASNSQVEITLELYVQVAESSNCADRVRGAFTIHCVRFISGNPIGTNCGLDNGTAGDPKSVAKIRRSGSAIDFYSLPIQLGSTGDDGIASFYTQYVDRGCGGYWRSEFQDPKIYILGQWLYPTPGTYGPSGIYYPPSCP